ARRFAGRGLGRHPLLHLARDEADLGKAVRAARAREPVEAAFEGRGRFGAKRAESGNVVAELFEALGKFGEVFALQLEHGLVERVAHRPRLRCSRARRAPATNAGAVLQCPRTSAPWRDARMALRSSTTLMMGMPGHGMALSTTSTTPKPRSTGPVAQRTSRSPVE